MNRDRKITTIQTVFISGNSLAVIIPSKVVEIKGINVGDYLEVSWRDIIQKDEEKENKKEKEMPKL